MLFGRLLFAACLAQACAEDDVDSCSGGGEVSLGSSMIQQATVAKQKAVLELEELRIDEVSGSEHEQVRHQAFLAGPLLTYFKHWSSGMVSHRLDTTLGESLELLKGGKPTPQPDARQVVELLHKQQNVSCPGAVSIPDMHLHDISTDDDGVHHIMLQSEEGSLQYIAILGEHVLNADPSLCASLVQAPKLSAAEQLSGEEHLLDLDTDPLVTDCVELFHETVKENCDFDLDLEAKSAVMQVENGLAVHMDVKLRKAGSAWTVHKITCDFEIPSDHRSPASLLQTTKQQYGPEVPQGTQAVLVMSESLCDSWSKDGVSVLESNIVNLMDTMTFGELSRYKGYEHVNEMLPKIDNISTSFAETMSSSDFRDRFPKCFPDGGAEVVRDQSRCGSCWAFAAASATMTQLCVSGMGSSALANANDRFEISVAQVMACNSAKRGCNGGNMGSAHAAFKDVGIIRERDSSYACGGGDPMKHFDQKSGTCTAFPWGRSCQKQLKHSAWNWGGAAAVSGAEKLTELVAAGHTLYATLDVYGNFMSHRSGVYSKLSGGKKGGHAVAMVGYGKEGNSKWWLLQNSWNTRWGEGGYGKILRGTNLAGIEMNAYYVRSWVSGGAVPLCFDGSSTGLRTQSGDIKCSAAKNYGNLCAHSTYGSQVKASCPVTCGACVGGAGSAQDWGKTKSSTTTTKRTTTTKKTTPRPTPSPSPSPTSPSPTPTPRPSPSSRRRRRRSRKSSRRRRSRKNGSRRRNRRRRRRRRPSK